MATSMSWRWFGRVAFAAGAVLVLGVRSREDRVSCHVCRGRKEVRTLSLAAWPLSRQEAISHPGRDIVHAHGWWRYSCLDSNGLTGFLGKAVGCNPHRYRDGSIDP